MERVVPHREGCWFLEVQLHLWFSAVEFAEVQECVYGGRSRSIGELMGIWSSGFVDAACWLSLPLL